MPADDEMMRKMDEAAEQAKAELAQNLAAWSAHDIIRWWANWYIKAEHKRLGRILVTVSKDLK
jgi:predicted flavoprotein YhiN